MDHDHQRAQHPEQGKTGLDKPRIPQRCHIPGHVAVPGQGAHQRTVKPPEAKRHHRDGRPRAGLREPRRVVAIHRPIKDHQPQQCERRAFLKRVYQRQPGLTIDHAVLEIGHHQQYQQRHDRGDRCQAGVERRPLPERPPATPYGCRESHNHPAACCHRQSAAPGRHAPRQRTGKPVKLRGQRQQNHPEQRQMQPHRDARQESFTVAPQQHQRGRKRNAPGEI